MLKSLRLGCLRRLSSLTGLERLTALERLDVDTCRAFHSIEEIGSLLNLRELFLNNDGKIETLSPVAHLDRLEWVGFSESTDIVDGDLTPLVELKSLSRVGFMNRRHYSHRCEDFGAAFFGSSASP